MHKIYSTIILVLAFVNVISQDFERIKKADEIVWFGLDFTKAKMIGTQAVDFTNPDQIVNHYFEAWNSLIISESRKYNLELAINNNIVYNIDPVNTFNRKVSSAELVTLDKNKLTDSDLKEITKKYAEEKDGVGMLFAVENFDKINTIGRMHVVFFEIKSGDVIDSHHLTGVTGGFGFRNFWATTIYNSIKKLKREYPKWDKR